MMLAAKTAILSVAFLNGWITSYAQLMEPEGPECTQGSLFIADRDAAKVYAFDLDSGLAGLTTPTTTLNVPGNPGQFLYVTGTNENFASIYRGTAAAFYADGRVNFINAGASVEEHGDHDHLEKGPPTIITNAGFDCARPIHFTNHDKKVAIFCDGSFEGSINSTVYVVHEAFMGQGGSAVVFQTTLQGSHHGAAVPVDDGHVLYSLAMPERIAKLQGSTSLPSTFQVVDYAENVLHSLTDINDPDTSCMGMHGEAAVDDTMVLACNQTHGGLVVVDYNAAGPTYSSRALEYPLENHRTGTLAHSPKTHQVVGNFASTDQTQFHLLAFDPKDTTALGASHVRTLETRQCSFAFEQVHGELLLVWLQTGKVQVYTLEPWTLVYELQVVPGMTACANATMTMGYNQAFIIAAATKKMYALDLEHVTHGEGIAVFESTLGFFPNSAVVAGVPAGRACSEAVDDVDDDDEEDGCTAFFLVCLLIWLIEILSFGLIQL